MSRHEHIRPASEPRSAPQSQVSTELPTDIFTDRRQRVALLAMVYALTFTIAWGVPTVMAMLSPDGGLLPRPLWMAPEVYAGIMTRPPVGIVAALASILGSLYVFVKVRGTDHAGDHVCGLSMLQLWFGAFGISVAEQWWAAPLHDPRSFAVHVPWVALWILAFPLLIPSVPKRALFGSLVATAMIPIGYVLSMATAGLPIQATHLALSTLPGMIATGLSWVGARAIFDLGETAHKARKLGSYELVDQIGRGGMGEVWRATHHMLKRPAAVKLIRADAGGTPGSEGSGVIMERFAREARATALLESPHTVTVYDYGVTNDGRFYYVMEYLEGFDLETLIDSNGPMPAERVVHLLKQAAASLADAHLSGLVHRDIKPGNLFVTRRGIHYDFLKVLDFGLVKAASGADARANKLTADGVASGTPAYMAPEVALGETEVHGRVDLYSLGCVAWWMLTGRLVFEAETPMKTVLMHIQKAPMPPSEVSELPIPASVEAIVMQLLEKDPDDRPADALELLEMLSTVELEQGWTDQRAKQWWTTHAPDVAVRRPESTPQLALAG